MRIRSVALTIMFGLTVVACGSTATAPSPSPSASETALTQWTKAYAFLTDEMKNTEIVCLWLTNSGGQAVPARHPAAFYTFTDSAWKGHTLTRSDDLPSGTFETCGATVPTTVPYGQAAIQKFLKPHGLSFVDEKPGLTAIEIQYAGQNGEDPDIIYRDKPGLFGLEGALRPLGASVFEPGTSKIVQPTDDKTAAEYLQFAAPLLRWYEYKG